MGEERPTDSPPTAVDLRLDLGGVVVAAGLEVGDVCILIRQVDVVEQGGMHQHAFLLEQLDVGGLPGHHAPDEVLEMPLGACVIGVAGKDHPWSHTFCCAAHRTAQPQQGCRISDLAALVDVHVAEVSALEPVEAGLVF